MRVRNGEKSAGVGGKEREIRVEFRFPVGSIYDLNGGLPKDRP